MNRTREVCPEKYLHEPKTKKGFDMTNATIAPNGQVFCKGDAVRTKKGANFCGVIVSFDADPRSHPGATILATHPLFAGTKHVYPLVQIEHDDRNHEERDQCTANVAHGPEHTNFEAGEKQHDA